MQLLYELGISKTRKDLTNQKHRNNRREGTGYLPLSDSGVVRGEFMQTKVQSFIVVQSGRWDTVALYPVGAF
ncbi:hypothetical protein GCM10025859_58900 [Alicyclobacillus fastidiosus]|nr:hypothetical protein GCM10025859_17520 [Alicyclobacillus fastidiosus]GMA62839.1 hypothetical protein GCM10025859_32790 [Alicyclobacillus fastidiosus]GMA63795.1 hypothetical protein GCM10025859_42350 [Alicyclobacillus fastidiosus]GMA65090.1 hypothetical protein GCM10025859_55300 [Alicyclobacillus fastidiosus]GMA65450.1 hypothetical protein GCM10025859_58900 [Alicyclobacillus fastidiosus]